jgi:PhoPQ-activated pathogenicity-related protein
MKMGVSKQGTVQERGIPMRQQAGFRLFVCIVLAFLSAWQVLVVATGLDDYVALADSNYTYSLANTVPGAGYTGYVLDMTSQTWRSNTEVNRTDWQHWVVLIVPSNVTSNKSLLFVNGGSNGGNAPTSVEQTLAGIALTTGTVVADVRMVPNQPLTFTGETNDRSEDEIIAYSWNKYLTTGDPNWPLQLPMVKSVVRAMDTIEDYCNSLGGAVADVNEFVVSGGSKRGWTTWLTAAVDSRVVAVVPAVIDMLNMEKSFRHHHGAYGFWAPAVHDYAEIGIFDWFGTAEMDLLMEIVDPYQYRGRLTMPKYMINSSGDEFFLPDSGRFYFDDLLPYDHDAGGKYIRYVPNTAHSLNNSAVESLAVFFRAILTGEQLPKFSWTLEEDGSIEVQTVGTAPDQVNLWQATNLTARDFRLLTIGDTWFSSTLADGGGGIYTASVSEPATGWTAFFVELVYNTGWLYDYKFTTVVRVVPDDVPYSCDFDFDSDVDMVDFALLASDWLATEYLIADIVPAFEGDEKVDLRDFTLFAEHWQD